MTEKSSSFSCHIFKDINCFLDVSGCFFIHFPHFNYFKFCQPFFILFYNSTVFNKILALFGAGVSDHEWRASSAEVTAKSKSSLLESWKLPIGLSVAGFKE